MFKVIEINKKDIEQGTKNYECSNDIYGILLKTDKYVNAKDMIHQISKMYFPLFSFEIDKGS